MVRCDMCQSYHTKAGGLKALKQGVCYEDKAAKKRLNALAADFGYAGSSV